MLRALSDCGKQRKIRSCKSANPLSNAMPDQHRRRTALTGSRPRRKSARAKTRYQIARVDSLVPGESLKFLLPIRGADEECFLINFDGEFHTYVNRCRTGPLPLPCPANHCSPQQAPCPTATH